MKIFFSDVKVQEKLERTPLIQNLETSASKEVQNGTKRCSPIVESLGKRWQKRRNL